MNGLRQIKMMDKQFSVILPVYHAEDPKRFKGAIASLLAQTVTPDEIIIVVDGPIGENLQVVIDDYESSDCFTLLYLEVNSGVGMARKCAIKQAKYDIIALMDSDDIACSDRFERQLPIICNKDADVVGGWIEEFISQPGDLGVFRILPELHQDIYNFGKWRMPVNNVTLMFTKSSYASIGGYSEQTRNEDWNLVVRLLANGTIFYNLPNTLVHVKSGNEMLVRRRGWTHQLTDIYIFILMYKLSYIGMTRLIINALLRILLLLMPLPVIAYIYSKFLRKKNQAS